MISFTPIIVKYVKKNLDIMKPLYSKQILPVPWPFVISRFDCIRLMLRASRGQFTSHDSPNRVY